MKTFFHILLASLMVVFFASCTDLNPDRSFYSGSPQPNSQTTVHMGTDEYTTEAFFPDGDAEQFIIYPRSGWILKPGEVIVFKALLLDEKTGKYKDVSTDADCHFESSFGGRAADGSEPNLINGEEITICAYWSGSTPYGAYSTGTFINDQEE